MNRDEALALLASSTENGKLATVRPDGSPHLVPVWYIVDDGDIMHVRFNV